MSKSVVKSTQIYYKSLDSAISKGFLEVGSDLTMKAFDKVKRLASDGLQVRSWVSLDSAQKSSIKMYSAGLAHEPLTEHNRATKRHGLVRAGERFMREFARLDGFNRIHTHMITLTLPNCNKGDLEDAVKDLSSKRRSLSMWLNDPKGNPLSVPVVGTLSAIEITVNRDKKKQKNSYGLYHPHLHLLLAVDGKLAYKKRLLTSKAYKTVRAVPADYATIMDKWGSFFADAELSSKAQFGEETYAKDGGTCSDAILEAVKYVSKSNDYLPSDYEDDWEVSIFAEVFKTIKGLRAHTTGGYWRDGKTLANRLDQKGWLTPFTVAFDMADKRAVTSIYDALTISTELKSGVVGHSHKLTPEELLYYNRDFLSKASFGFPMSKVVAKGSEKGRKALEVMQAIEKRYKMQVGTVDGLLDRLFDQTKFTKAKWHDFSQRLLRMDKDDDNYKKVAELESVNRRAFEAMSALSDAVGDYRTEHKGTDTVIYTRQYHTGLQTTILLTYLADIYYRSGKDKLDASDALTLVKHVFPDVSPISVGIEKECTEFVGSLYEDVKGAYDWHVKTLATDVLASPAGFVNRWYNAWLGTDDGVSYHNVGYRWDLAYIFGNVVDRVYRDGFGPIANSYNYDEHKVEIKISYNRKDKFEGFLASYK
ncbi:protein rep [Ligilactobacillus equi]